VSTDNNSDLREASRLAALASSLRRYNVPFETYIADELESIKLQERVAWLAWLKSKDPRLTEILCALRAQRIGLLRVRDEA
jgi:Cdc6-like AAA superfamily ATPase